MFIQYICLNPVPVPGGCEAANGSCTTVLLFTLWVRVLDSPDEGVVAYVVHLKQNKKECAPSRDANRHRLPNPNRKHNPKP